MSLNRSMSSSTSPTRPPFSSASATSRRIRSASRRRFGRPVRESSSARRAFSIADACRRLDVACTVRNSSTHSATSPPATTSVTVPRACASAATASVWSSSTSTAPMTGPVPSAVPGGGVGSGEPIAVPASPSASDARTGTYTSSTSRTVAVPASSSRTSSSTRASGSPSSRTPASRSVSGNATGASDELYISAPAPLHTRSSTRRAPNSSVAFVIELRCASVSRASSNASAWSGATAYDRTDVADCVPSRTDCSCMTRPVIHTSATPRAVMATRLTTPK